MELIQPQRLELCEISGLDHGSGQDQNVVRTRTVSRTMTASEENASYSALVDSSGF
ncbi:hypothetical protein HID58_035805 [Brassica napus]|uniref:Uncharacterized protein n=1 Tax=Brassica napus TaxID=3708 RepID=A0ABQ8C5Y5_BRANA|nr:hypothetical protein HID58_035805 [Brassica napus]